MIRPTTRDPPRDYVEASVIASELSLTLQHLSLGGFDYRTGHQFACIRSLERFNYSVACLGNSLGNSTTLVLIEGASVGLDEDPHRKFEGSQRQRDLGAL